MSDYERRQVARREDDAEVEQAAAALGGLKLTPEWRLTLAVLSGGWPGTASTAEQVAYVTLLADVGARDVAVALKQLAAKGQQYRPTPVEVRRELGRVVKPPELSYWQQSFRAYEGHYGREKTIKYLDPDGERVDEYPPPLKELDK